MYTLNGKTGRDNKIIEKWIKEYVGLNNYLFKLMI